MTDPILTPEVYGPDDLGKAKAAIDRAEASYCYRVQVSDDAPACTTHRELIDAAKAYAEHRDNGDPAEVFRITHPLKGGEPTCVDVTRIATGVYAAHLVACFCRFPLWLLEDLKK